MQPMIAPLSFWVLFHIAVLLFLAADLFLLHRRPRPVRPLEAAAICACWVLLSFGFGLFVWERLGRDKGLEFFAGYLVEYSLSMDNLFVFIVIFASFAVPVALQHRVLFLGILGALVMRGAMIFILGRAVARWHGVLYLFGAFLCFTGLRLLFARDDKPNPEEHFILRLCRRCFTITPGYVGKRFIVRDAGRTLLTPLALVLIVVECTDLVFAVDSIPAVFAITADPFIVYTSNVCAILGLRSLYFLLARMMDRFAHLKIGLSLVLLFIGAKMLVARWYKIPTEAALGVVAAILAASVLFSLSRTSRAAPR